MPVVKKLDGPGAGRTSKTMVHQLITAGQVELPTEPSIPSDNLLDYTMFIYGEKKIGKTSLAAQFPDTLFLMFEPGGKALRIFQTPVNNWAEFVAYVDLLEADQRFQTVVIDTVDIAYNMCFDAMCKRMGIAHPTDENDFGKSWGQIENEFVSQMTRLLNLPKGVLLISHSVEKEVKTRFGQRFNRVTPTVPTQAYRYLTGVVDIWAYYGYENQGRALTIAGNEYIEAGCRLEEHFLTTSGERVRKIPMGSSASEAYANLVSAFNNRQETPDGLPGETAEAQTIENQGD